MTIHEEARRARVLVIDDTEQNRALAEAILEDEGMEAILAAGGEEGLRAFEREHPDCVLLDLRMPGLDGFAVFERLRALPGGKETPVIFLTAHRDIETFDRALRAGGDDFLTLPFQPHELAARVRTALQLRKLGAEVQSLYELVRKQRDDLLRHELQKARLMAFVVHDLKNPVNTIDLLAQLLARDKGDPEGVHESAGMIRSAVRHMSRLIQNLLDLSKSDEGKLVPVVEEIDAPALVAEALAQVQLLADEKRVTLTSTVELATLRGDRDLLDRVLENLVENAVRHAPEGSRVLLTLRAGEGHVELRVEDEGPGIPEALRAQIFEPFFQISEATGPRTGRGLGLSFCKCAVEAHGGTISAAPAKKGAVICVRLPDVR